MRLKGADLMLITRSDPERSGCFALMPRGNFSALRAVFHADLVGH